MEFKSLSASSVNDIMDVEKACHDFPWSEKTLSSCLLGRYFNQGLYEEDNLIGFYIAEQAGPDVTLMDICISPNRQGEGLSKKLMSHLIEQATSRQAEMLFLEVRASNFAAISLYQQFGFSEMGVRKGYYPAQQGNEDAILMALTLSF